MYIHPSVEIFSEVDVVSCILNRTSNQLERSCLSTGFVLFFALQLKIYIQTQLATKNGVKSHAGTSIAINSMLNSDLSKVIRIKERFFGIIGVTSTTQQHLI